MFCWTVHVNGSQLLCFGAAAAVQHEVYAFIRRRCYGNNDQTMITANVFNTESLSWRTLTTVRTGLESSRRVWGGTPQGHTAVLIDHIVYIWGGCPPNSNMLHAFDVDTHSWSKPRVSGTVPEGRQRHSACVLGKVMYVHGGYTKRYNDSNDMYKLDTSTMVWSLINTALPASSRHSATVIGTKMFVFGGEGNDQCRYEHRQGDCDCIRVFDTETNRWLGTRYHPYHQLCPGRDRGMHSAFAYNGELYIITTGGGNFLTGLWKFNPHPGHLSWTKVEPKGKALRRVYWKSCFRVGDRIFFFGVFYTREGRSPELQILDLSPSLKTLSKLAVDQYKLEQSELPHNIRWELRAMKAKFLS